MQQFLLGTTVRLQLSLIVSVPATSVNLAITLPNGEKENHAVGGLAGVIVDDAELNYEFVYKPPMTGRYHFYWTGDGLATEAALRITPPQPTVPLASVVPALALLPGTVETLPFGSDATLTIRQIDGNSFAFDFGIPEGAPLQVKDVQGNVLGPLSVVRLTQEEYDALPEIDPLTFYMIAP